MKPRVYIETTVPSYLAAWPSRDLIRAAHQQITREWWARRDRFDLFSSRLVVRECEAGDPRAAADRLDLLGGIPLLEQTPAVHGLDYLLTWNCAHIANAILRPRIEAVCRVSEYEPPLICTPEELPTGGHDHD